MNPTGLVMEYEDILLGNRDKFSSGYVGTDTNPDHMARLLRYVFEEVLRWTPEQSFFRLSREYVDKLCFSKFLVYLKFPKELDMNTDLFYIAKFAYPKVLSLKRRDIIIRAYEKVLKNKKEKFLKNFFLENEGYVNKKICFVYAINQFLDIHDIRGLYDYFSDGKKAIAFLKKYRLYEAYKDFYLHPVDMFHECIHTDERDEFYYRYKKFLIDYKDKRGVLP